ncbi:MAG TPA: 1-deoxy-D-xylulose-5-phosphate reductoisomerase [Caldisericia bacterium]|nr:1-deoxy-D-xylulose-5-phosphate reductoisomerase [Caldisericia bacterium]HPF49583.1 1-deoxy-D-xylulose-5-phosphate reductoisomerase [Caldisericia bacterium]HPI84501.1 1-deoxy-D-xylulose-5-phosphate reductoisomerase [Caldisericia bacterium]HPQ93867.1 1-deoxy-D-xylulose-5-phosphate reductoisomerase [Caldisericia bacterium]HRV75412.1 1-deoxy-D-xylulose-5-phosphate reductoisomerase [Caldisericia bacterium]
MKKIAIIGSTGSIGTQTLDVIRSDFSQFRVVALAANKSVDAIAVQAREFGVNTVCLYDNNAASRLDTISKGLTVLTGDRGLAEIAAMDIDILVVSGNGVANIAPTLIALNRGTKVALATKEVIVCAGHLISDEQLESQIVPIDSEPSAIYQSLLGEDKLRIREILLTASGGPFFSKGMKWGQLTNVRPEDALSHPKWNMGAKISIDSATLANKGLELMEISMLFGIDPDRIRILIHPEAIVHSGVAFVDGSTKLQASPPSMKYPISFALNHPTRNLNDLRGVGFPVRLTFDDMPEDVSRSIQLARKAYQMGACGRIAYTAADEWAVGAFLSNKLPFYLIPEIIGKTLSEIDTNSSVNSVSEIKTLYNKCTDIACEIGRRLCQRF